jgi:hypothetical protein
MLTTGLSKNMPDALEYMYEGNCPHEALEMSFQNKTLAVVKNHRGHDIDLNEHILALSFYPCALGKRVVFLTKTNGQGNTVSPFTLLSGLLGLTDDDTRKMLITKTKAVWNGK